MQKVIDLECDLPADENGNPRKPPGADHPPGYGDPERLPPLDGHGFSNYARIFTKRSEDSTPGAASTKRTDGMSMTEFVERMDRAGVEIGLLRAGNPIVTEVLAGPWRSIKSMRVDRRDLFRR